MIPKGIKRRYSLSYLNSLPTLAEGQADDLKIEKPGVRVWLSRMTKEDGMPYNNRVTVETLRSNGSWRDLYTYQAR